MPINPPPRRRSAFVRQTSDAKKSTPAHSRSFLTKSVSVGRKGKRRFSVSVSTALIGTIVIIIVLGLPLYNLANSLHQRHQVSIEYKQAQETNSALKEELQSWSDPDYISAQARERLGYVKPGETRYKIVDPTPDSGRENNSEQHSDRPWFFALADSALAADKPAADSEISTQRRGIPADGATEVPPQEGTK